MVLNPSSVAPAPDFVGVVTPSTTGDVVGVVPQTSNTATANKTTSGKVSQRSNKSNKSGKEKTDHSTGRRSSKGVLKAQTSFSGIKIAAETIEGPRRLTFADEHGEMLVVNVFVDNLHYGENQISLNNIGPEPTQKCCTIS